MNFFAVVMIGEMNSLLHHFYAQEGATWRLHSTRHARHRWAQAAQSKCQKLEARVWAAATEPLSIARVELSPPSKRRDPSARLTRPQSTRAQWHRPSAPPAPSARLAVPDAGTGQLLTLRGWCFSSVASDESPTGKQKQVFGVYSAFTHGWK